VTPAAANNNETAATANLVRILHQSAASDTANGPSSQEKTESNAHGVLD